MHGPIKEATGLTCFTKPAAPGFLVAFETTVWKYLRETLFAGTFITIFAFFLIFWYRIDALFHFGINFFL